MTSAALPFAVGALSLLGYWLAGSHLLHGFAIELGSTNRPTGSYLAFLLLWAVFGGLAAPSLAVGLSRALSGQAGRLRRWWNAPSDRQFVLATVAAAIVIPAALRAWVLHAAPLTDDEGAFRFAAQLLASGRTWVPSPPMKLFFDQNFMINDGRLYPMYFLGWPALLATGVLTGMPGLVNPVLSALTVPPLFDTLRRYVGRSWARGGVVLFLSAPFLQIAAATELSYTASLMALTWALCSCLRTGDSDPSWRAHAGFGLSVALAFSIRPQSAVPLGLPMAIWWAANLRPRPPRIRVKALVAFALPAAVLAALFLASVRAQTGSPWRPGYVRYGQYMAENDFRFTALPDRYLAGVPGFDFAGLGQAMARTEAGLFRLNADLFGWPAPFGVLALMLAGFDRRQRLLWGMAGSFLILRLFQRDWGVDTFGPVHGFELALPVLMLTLIGARNLHTRFQKATWSAAGEARDLLAPTLLAALIATAWLGFAPVRLGAVHRVAEHLNRALEAPGQSGLHLAVIFAPLPFASPCPGVPDHFVRFRPPNDPDLHDDVLWVNHLNLGLDSQFMQTMPGRVGYVMVWTAACHVSLVPLASASDDAVPPGRQRL